MSRRLILSIAFTVVALAACSTQFAAMPDPAELPLPQPQALGCCYLLNEQLRVSQGENTYLLSSAVAITEHGMSLLLFDPSGRKLLQLSQQDGSVQVTHNMSAEQLEPRWLLASFYLVHAQNADWPPHKKWKVSGAPKDRRLTYLGQPLLKAQPFANPPKVASPQFDFQLEVLQSERSPL